jgi:hypothetical protein
LYALYFESLPFPSKDSDDKKCTYINSSNQGLYLKSLKCLGSAKQIGPRSAHSAEFGEFEKQFIKENKGPNGLD